MKRFVFAIVALLAMSSVADARFSSSRSSFPSPAPARVSTPAPVRTATPYRSTTTTATNAALIGGGAALVTSPMYRKHNSNGVSCVCKKGCKCKTCKSRNCNHK